MICLYFKQPSVIFKKGNIKVKILKNSLLILLCAAMLFCASCGSKTENDKTSDSPPSGTSSDNANDKFDYDFTKMGQSVAYAKLTDFMNDQPSFEGKTMKITGDYYAQPSDDGKNTYYYIILNDTTACCSAYIEFLAEKGVEYPKKASDAESGNIVKITASGKVGSYQEYGKTYYALMVDKIY